MGNGKCKQNMEKQKLLITFKNHVILFSPSNSKSTIKKDDIKITLTHINKMIHILYDNLSTEYEVNLTLSHAVKRPTKYIKMKHAVLQIETCKVDTTTPLPTE